MNLSENVTVEPISEDIDSEPVLDKRATLTQGNVVINSVVCVYQNDDVQLWEIDCRTKYAELISYGSGSKMANVYINATENSVRPHPTITNVCTIVELVLPNSSWELYCCDNGGRYTFRFIMFDRTKRQHLRIFDIQT